MATASILNSNDTPSTYLSYDLESDQVLKTMQPIEDLLSEINRPLLPPLTSEQVVIPSSIKQQRVAVIGLGIPGLMKGQLPIQKSLSEALGQPGIDDDQNGLVDDLSGWNWYTKGPDVYTSDSGTNLYRNLTIGDNNKLIPVVVSEEGKMYLADFLSGLHYAISKQPDIIVMPDPNHLESQSITLMLKQVKEKGTKLIFY